MSTNTRPDVRPANPNFSSGPCAKRPGWSADQLAGALVGRSHRHPDGRARLLDVLTRTREVLGVPESHRIAIVPASDTGAMEMALWSLLGARGVDVLSWENFGRTWAADVTGALGLADVRVIEAPYGEFPDLARLDFARDVVFCWNGTTSGVCVPGGDWIARDRAGLTICDATSAVFAMDLPWDRLDVTTYSWQKALGGEAAHGMLILGPRAVERLESYVPPWPLPKIFRLTKDGGLFSEPFEGLTINTPSMLCVEDAIDALKWVDSIGGQAAMEERARANFAVIEAWVQATPWIDFLAVAPATRSWTSVCLRMRDPWFAALAESEQKAGIKRMAKLLEDEGVAYDIAGHRAAPPSFRIWAGATVAKANLEALMPWLDWAFAEFKAESAAAARGG